MEMGAAIAAMPPGRKPTEPGYYVCDDPRTGTRVILELTPYHLSAGSYVLDLYAFVARIYPERVEPGPSAGPDPEPDR